MNLNFRNTLAPLLLILACPPFVMLMWYTNTSLNGSLALLGNLIINKGLFTTIYDIWQPLFWGTSTAWKIILIFVGMQIVLMRFLPGSIFYGPITPKGNIPKYTANGPLAFTITMFVFCMATFYFQWFSAALLYDNLGGILGALNISSLFICVLLYLKGRFFPSSSDASITNNVLFDYYWGTELYPQVFGLHIKKFITCRFGMMSWGLFLISHAAKQVELGGLSNSMLISVALQLIYIAKFFLWETGYLRSLDIMHDRAGFYICWGCMVWVPCVYTSPSMYLVLHPINLSWGLATLIFITGLFGILINYWSDLQRMKARVTGGDCTIWGKRPLVLPAKYITSDGNIKHTILLASGWWGITRHFHYIPEIIAALCWSIPALFTNFIPYFYVCFLTILLVDRAFRDDRRCFEKYGQYWEAYCKKVPYKIIPFVI